MSMTLLYTGHAINRQAQRNLSCDDIEFVLQHGRRMRCAGAIHVFLGQRDIPQDKVSATRFGRLEGTTLVMDDCQEQAVLITAYRNRNGLKQIRAKTKYERCRG